MKRIFLTQLDKVAAFCTKVMWQIPVQEPDEQVTSELNSTVDDPLYARELTRGASTDQPKTSQVLTLVPFLPQGHSGASNGLSLPGLINPNREKFKNNRTEKNI